MVTLAIVPEARRVKETRCCQIGADADILGEDLSVVPGVHESQGLSSICSFFKRNHFSTLLVSYVYI